MPGHNGPYNYLHLTCPGDQGDAVTDGPIVLWLDPISPAYVSVPPQTKDIFGSVSFKTLFTSARLVGEGGQHRSDKLQGNSSSVQICYGHRIIP